MKIEILGSGCAKCKKLYDLVEKAVASTSISAEVTKVEKLENIMKHGVAFTPALVIDGEVKSAGSLPNVSQIEEWCKAKKTSNNPR